MNKATHNPTEDQISDLLKLIQDESPDGVHKLPTWFNHVMLTTGLRLGASVVNGQMPIGTALITAMKVAFKIGARANERGWTVK